MAIKGTTQECLRDYLKKLPWDSRSCAGARKPLMDFCELTAAGTIRRWYSDNIMPAGLTLIRLRYFLEKEGYQVTELMSLPKVVHGLGWLIAWNKLDFERTRKYIGFASRDEFIQFLHGYRNISSGRMIKASELVEASPAVRQVPVAPLDIFDGGAPEPLSPKVISQADVKDVAGELLPLLRVLKELTPVISAHLKVMLSDNTSSDDRRLLREQAGYNFVFDLSNLIRRLNKLLDALCGERARERMINNDGNIPKSKIG